MAIAACLCILAATLFVKPSAGPASRLPICAHGAMDGGAHRCRSLLHHEGVSHQACLLLLPLQSYLQVLEMVRQQLFPTLQTMLLLRSHLEPKNARCDSESAASDPSTVDPESQASVCLLPMTQTVQPSGCLLHAVRASLCINIMRWKLVNTRDPAECAVAFVCTSDRRELRGCGCWGSHYSVRTRKGVS